MVTQPRPTETPKDNLHTTMEDTHHQINQLSVLKLTLEGTKLSVAVAE